VPSYELIAAAELAPDLTPEGAPLQITQPPVQAYAPTAELGGSGIRVGWHDKRTGDGDIWTAAIDNPASAAPVQTHAGDQFVPRMAWNGNGWGVVYHDDRAGVWQVYLARMDASATMRGETRMSDGTFDATFASVAWAGAWIVTWQEHVAAYVDQIMAMRFDDSGAPIGSPVVVAMAEGVGQPALAITPTGDVGIAWQEAHIGVELHFARVVCSP